MTDCGPLVENFVSAPLNPTTDQCYYNTTEDKYYIYLNNNGIEILPRTEDDIFVLQYKAANDTDGNTAEYLDFGSLRSAIITAKDTYRATDMNIYYGSLTEPTQRCRLITSLPDDAHDYSALVERGRLINNIYVGEIVGVIYPKIIYNNQVINHIVFNNNENDVEEETYFNNQLVHKVFPHVDLKIIETSTPADLNKGYKIGETITLKYQYINKGNLLPLNNVHLGTEDSLNATIDEIINIDNQNLTKTYTRTHTVTEEECTFQTELTFSLSMFYSSSYAKTEDINITQYQKIKIAQGHQYGDLTYTDSNNNTNTTRYMDYEELNTFLTNTTLNIINITIVEGGYYD